MDSNKIKEIKEPSRFKKFLKSYYSNLTPILFFVVFAGLGMHSIISIGAVLMYNNYWHIIANVLLWVGFKTYCDGEY